MIKQIRHGVPPLLSSMSSHADFLEITEVWNLGFISAANKHTPNSVALLKLSFYVPHVMKIYDVKRHLRPTLVAPKKNVLSFENIFLVNIFFQTLSRRSE